MLRVVVGAMVAATLLSVTAVRSGEKKEAQKIDLKGSWNITWGDDANNVNPINVAKSGDKFEGSYVNDAKETCSIVGKFDKAKRTVEFTITSPNWEIVCTGRVVDGNLIEGSYVAYGSTKGDFKMARENNK